MPRILRARIGTDYHIKLRELLRAAADGDEIRLFLGGAVVDATKLLQTIRPELTVTFRVEPISEWTGRSQDVATALLADKSASESVAACKERVADLLADEGFEEFLEPHKVTGATWYDAGTGIAILLTGEAANTLRQRIEKLAAGHDINCCVIVWALPEQRLRLSETHLVDVIESVPVWYVRKLVK